LDDLTWNLLVMAGCYTYIVAIILVSERLPFSKKVNRKVLHAMIGNLPLIMPLFSAPIFSFLVASPFILVTFLATPYSPVKLPGRLGSLTEEGHSLGLVMYAISYSALAWLYGVTPYVVAAGIFPMAYGDSAAALIGQYYGKHKYNLTEPKSFEGSAAMLAGSFFSVLLGFLYFNKFFNIAFVNILGTAAAIAVLVTLVEGVAPRGLDNLAVPAVGALTFILMNGGV